MKKIVLLFVLFSGYCFSQGVNDYQYVIVPVKYDLLSKDDQYGLNTLTKLLLQKYGFKAYLSNEEIPLNVENQRCNFLYANLIQDKGMFVTKVKVALKDCKEKVVFETQFGESREKEYAVAYNKAIRDTEKSFDRLAYKYNGKNGNISEVTTLTNQLETEPKANSVATTTGNDLFYFAQPTANGYQVVDSEPKVIMKLFTTSQKNVFIAEKGSKKGVLLPKGNQWSFEYYENGKTVSEQLNLKF